MMATQGAAFGRGGLGVTSPGQGGKAAPFSRTASTTDSSFASTTVTLPRSSKPIGVALIATAACLVLIQGNGQEFYSRPVTPNVPSYISLGGYPEVTSVVVQSKFPAKGTVQGAIDYN